MTVPRRIACTLLVVATTFVAATGVASAGQQQDMMARMAAMQTRLTALADQMNAATGEARINAMTALLNAMLEEHKAMRAGMMMGGAAAKDNKMCTMMNNDKPAASSDSPAHVHP